MTETQITTVQKYKENLYETVELPSGAVFKMKRRLGYGDYLELLNVLGAVLNKEPSTELFEEASKNSKALAEMIAYIVPKVCIEPKISLMEQKDTILLSDLSLDDMLFIQNRALRLDERGEVNKVMESFRKE